MSDSQPISGRIFVVVGPSGSGKDTLINWLREKLTDEQKYMFVRRSVTRSPDGQTEDHDTLTKEQFELAKQKGKFAVTWDAHGLSYGIPIGVLAHVHAGGIAIANGSRRALAEMHKQFPHMVVVNLRVDRAVLAGRLAGRGREDAEQIKKRLDRMDIPLAGDLTVFNIENSGPIEKAGRSFIELLSDLEHVPAT
ncbi:phosphonate metabolism protein/1,5-bisphosphokinase (PRPP-forming) PhnN [Ahrensia kielensis]|uniref:phosphonate metabolism protein/1,5-bisphosphokinase (PRPP-forming) PhnN n=1 Tax=Ahrensia kielensis TaxID=76980 RepID=UPI00035DB5AC|nr:phosphonate metabolism protein/1,5-bisphosphokinase (PRPP-forming) PhnN [Ahrensia kielensis]